jgi:hypothetical protein
VIKSSGIPEQRTEWIKSLEFVKTFLTRPPPVMIEYVEDIKKEAFNLNTVVDGKSILRKPSTYMDVAERICSKAYKENGVTLRASYDNGDKEICFQIQTMVSSVVPLYYDNVVPLYHTFFLTFIFMFYVI